MIKKLQSVMIYVEDVEKRKCFGRRNWNLWLKKK